MSEITPIAIRTWAHLGQRGAFFGVALPDIADKRPDVNVITADVMSLSALTKFSERYPGQFLNVGIAEQNLIGIAAGMASEGKCVFATTYAEFITMRAAEQVRHNLSYHGYNVKLVGGAAGTFNSKSGISHWATEDMAYTRTLPGMLVLSPADALEAIKMAYAVSEDDRPAYIRLSGGPSCKPIYKEDYDFRIGKGIVLKEGRDIAIIATGLMVNESLRAEKLLTDKGLSCSVINIHTVKPLDTGLLDEMFERHRMIVTVEEHNVIGGLGGAVAEYKATKINMPPQVFIGIKDFNGVGSQQHIWEVHGLTADKIADRIVAEYERSAD